MPLATKNGSLIVKDGLLAENCGCCGGWYCCDPRPLQCGGVASIIDSVSVVITTGGDYILHEQATGGCFLGQAVPVFAKAISIVPVGAMSGTHHLSLQSGDASSDTRVWRKNLVDGAGCSGPFIQVTVENSYTAGISQIKYTTVLAYRKYQWQKISRTMPTESKSLADMLCESSSSGSSSSCFIAPLENYVSALAEENRENTGLPCEKDASATWSVGLSRTQIFTQAAPADMNVVAIEKTFESGSTTISLQINIVGKQ